MVSVNISANFGKPLNAVAETALEFSDNAARKVKQLIEEEGNPDLKLRVFVQGGGCSGFQYGFTFDDKVNEGDHTVEKDGVTLVVDPMSYEYLAGSEIDYKESLEGSMFVVNNPNATTTCGCGASFAV
ncbi:MAG TPA: iron-sulfur cluster insertion protein ErpA [Gammaproteobacteria bacterium]|nr:iron-sulfur cluster insertion protein ErpA [Gammaproteobacteria bacterium]